MKTNQGVLFCTVLSFLLPHTHTHAVAATNDLVLTSIVKEGGCVTLQWRSHVAEFYTVYWTDHLETPIFWRVAEVNVPSGGTNTVWSEGDCQQQMMMAGGGSGGSASAPPLSKAALSAEERAAFIEKHKDWATAAYLYPPGHPKFIPNTNATVLKAATVPAIESTSGEGLTLEAASEGGGQPLALLSSAPTANRFYRVARTAVSSRVAGWGAGVGNMPVTLSNIFAVSAGCAANVSHSLALRADGSVTAWGANFYGQTNVPGDVADAVAVAAGGHHSFALLRDGSLRGWGYNGLGQLDVPAHATNLADIKAGCWHSIALRADGTVVTWGNLYSDPAHAALAVPAGLSNVTAVAAGAFHCLALKHDGTVMSWGI